MSDDLTRERQRVMVETAIKELTEQLAMHNIDRDLICAVISGWAIGQAVHVVPAEEVASSLRKMADTIEVVGMPVAGHA
ncbi:hypothetical protein KHP62_02415 [Rhodobacteraceae bacterium NNCM2]|nr:hypothetical protein [Coraliihabitans acroporae]